MRTIVSTLLSRSPYLATFVLTLGLGLVSLPLVISHLGSSVWTAMALGQAIGGFGAVAMAFGYDIFGPTRIATSPGGARRQIYLDSLVVRAMTGTVAVSAVVCVSYSVASNRIVTTLSALMATLLGAGAGWVFIGAGRALRYFVCDSLPRICGTGLGLVAVVMGCTAVELVLIQIAGQIVAASAGAIGVRKLSENPPSFADARKNLPQNLRTQVDGFAVGGAAGLYNAAPVVIVSVIAPAALTEYALVDKLSRFTTAGLNIIVQVYQGWVPAAATPAAFRKRAAWALRSSGAICVVVGVGFAGGTLVVAPALSRSAISPGWELTVPLGVALAFVTLSQCIGLVLLPAMGERRIVMRSTVLAAVVGIPLAAAATAAIGASGAAWSVAVVELVVVTVQARQLRRSFAAGGSGASTSVPPTGRHRKVDADAASGRLQVGVPSVTPLGDEDGS